MLEMAGAYSGLMINSRVEAVDDPQLNNKLFAFYERLVNPFAEVEGLYQKIEADTDRISACRQSRKYCFTRAIKTAAKVSVLAFVLVCVVLFGTFFIAKVDLLLSLAELLAFPGAEDFLFGFLFLWLPMGMGLVSGVLSLAVNLASASKEITTCEADMQKCKAQLDEKLPALKNVACLIPPQYRNSVALRFFVEAYSNSKIDNLKEAVNLFDTQSYRNQMLVYQENIICALQSISFNMSMISNQLDSIEFAAYMF